MKPSEMSLFTKKEQYLLLESENKWLEDLDEEALAMLLSRVRRARKKYTDLDRRQSIDAMEAAGRRAATASSNERTRRKAEIMEDAVSRVARYLSRAARANANKLKRERIEAAKRRSTPKPSTNKRRTAAKTPAKSASQAKTQKEIISPARKGAASAANKRAQANKDGGKRGS